MKLMPHFRLCMCYFILFSVNFMVLIRIMQACMDVTVPYLMTRTAFGKPLGEFQVSTKLTKELLD